jgi:hypothetical protein
MGGEARTKGLLAVTFATTGTGYMADLDGWRDSMTAIGLPFHAAERPNLGSWFANAAQRAPFLLECLDLFGQKYDVLWVDVDARAEAYPDQCVAIHQDMAACWIGSGICGGTVLYRDTPGARGVLSELIEANARDDVEKTDQNLGPIVRRRQRAGELTVRWLHGGYAHIAGIHPRGTWPIVFRHRMAGFEYWGAARRGRKAEVRRRLSEVRA